MLYLWGPQSVHWPHFMLLSFYLCAFLIACMVAISLTDKSQPEAETGQIDATHSNNSRLVVVLWAALAVVMIGLYIFFN